MPKNENQKKNDILWQHGHNKKQTNKKQEWQGLFHILSKKKKKKRQLLNYK